MKKYIPIMIALVLVIVGAFVVVKQKSFNNTDHISKEVTVGNIGSFMPRRSCAILPEFIKKLGIKRPMIDLTQERFKGIAILSGNKVLHPKIWERFEHFSTYALDEKGNIYLAPMPYISIKPTTFNLQKNIYKLDTRSGEISIFMQLEDVKPNASNPYGIISLVYDCEDQTIWVSAIDETDYTQQRGVIYHLDVQSKKILQKSYGLDALTLQLIYTKKGKYLLAGAARENALYAYKIKQNKLDNSPIKIFDLPSSSEHIRKIKIKKANMLELETIPFTYTLVARTTKQDRMHYDALWENTIKEWKITKISNN